MSAAPLTPAQSPAAPDGPSAAPSGPRRHAPSRGLLVAALVVAVVLLIGSVGATATFVHDRLASGFTRVEGPGGRMFVFPDPDDRAGQTYRMPQGPGRGGMPMGPGRRYAPGPNQSSPTPSPSSSAG